MVNSNENVNNDNTDNNTTINCNDNDIIVIIVLLVVLSTAPLLGCPVGSPADRPRPGGASRRYSIKYRCTYSMIRYDMI